MVDRAHWAVGEHIGVCGDILKVCVDMECVGGHSGRCVEMCWGVWKFFGVGGVYLMQCGDKLGSDDVWVCGHTLGCLPSSSPLFFLLQWLAGGCSPAGRMLTTSSAAMPPTLTPSGCSSPQLSSPPPAATSSI